ncbi:MAG TPA: PAS domain S-box protein [Vicinamibacterales bacterium]|nr:PAS domain S-box protein [Vicinamibacterales bacterium]
MAPTPTETQADLQAGGRSNASIADQFHVAAGTIAGLVALAGLAVLLGWVFDVPSLKRPFADSISMKPNTALGLIFSGLALALYQVPKRSLRTDRALQVAAGIAIAIGTLTLVEYLVGMSLGIDQLLFVDDPDAVATEFPGRMARSTAACFILFNIGILFGASLDRYLAPQLAAMGVLAIATVSTTSFFIGQDSYTGLAQYTAMAAHEAWCFLLLALGFFFARPSEGLMEVVSDEGPAGYVVRRLLPAVFLVPILLAIATARGEVYGWYDSAYGTTLFVATAVGSLGAVVWAAGQLLRRLEDKRVTAERERRQSEERLSRAVTGAPVPMVIYDDAGTIHHMSQGWTTYSGYTMDEVPTISAWIEAAQPSSRADVQAYLRKLYHATGVVEAREAPITTRVGETRIWEFSTTPLGRLSSGRQAFLTMGVDITKRRQAETDLRSLNESLEQRIAARTQELTEANDALRRQSSQLKEQAALLDIASDAILVRDLAGTIVYWSAGAQQMFGWPRDVALGAHSHRLLRTEFAQPVVDIEQIAVAAGHWEGEVVQTRQDGTRIEVESRWSLTRNERGSAQGFLEVHRDITERRRAEARLRESELRFRAVAETANAGILTMDEGGIIRYWNPGAATMFGLSEAEAIGRTLESLVPERHREAHRRGFQEFLDSGMTTLAGGSLEATGVRANGSEFPFEIALSGWDTSEGRFVSGILRDITDRRQADGAIRAKNEELGRSNQELEQFAYVASHDLQEPLRMVSNYTQMLASRYGDKLDDDGREFIGYAVDGAKRMQALIHDLLQLARVGSRGKEFRPTPLARVIEDATANLAGAIDDGNATVTVGPLPTLACDGGQLIQVFQNLIGNALKFRHPDRPPEVRVAAEQTDDGWTLSVADNGIGIDPKYFQRIFQMFQRLHGPGSYPGTGIGLALVRKIVERHGGHVSIESTPGEGTTFFVFLPEAAAHAPGGDRPS